MRIIFTGDWQASIGNLDRCQQTLDQLIQIVRKSPAFVVHLGDVKDALNPVDQRVSNFLVDAFKCLAVHSLGTYVVRGNHDPVTTQDGSPSCSPVLRAAGAKKVADKFELVILRGSSMKDRVALYLVPFFRNMDTQRGAFKEALDARKINLNRANHHVLAFHAELKGCRMSPFARGKGLSLDDIGASRYDLCVGGHIHLQQQLAPNVWYCGSPFPQDWGECNSPHGFLEVTF